MNDSISVAITTFDRPDALSSCLDALNIQTDKSFDIIIVNGGEMESVNRLVTDFSSQLKIKVVQQSRKGLVEARNLCWRESQEDIVCIVDDDLVVSSNWVKEIKSVFSQDDKIGGVTGPTIIRSDEFSNRDALAFIEKFEHGGFFWKLIGKLYLGFIMEGRAKEIGKILDCGTFTLGSNYPDCLKVPGLIDIDYLEACQMCLRRNLIEKVGGFDYCYTGTSEWCEPDLAFKIKKLGYRLVFNPRAVTEHRVSEQGVFKARTYAFERSVNFINFYFRHIKPNNLNKFVRFHSYLIFMNCYWIYKAIKHKNLNWLTGILGLPFGLIKNLIFKFTLKGNFFFK